MRPVVRLAVLAALVILLAAPFVRAADQIRYVIDGDTLVLEDNQRIRLIGVDAPEVDHPRYNRIGEPFGHESRDYLKRRLEGREVRLENGPEAFDKYGRRLAYVFEGETLVNAELIELGYAEAMRSFPHPRRDEFLELEARARADKKGLWEEKSPAPPTAGIGWMKPLGWTAAGILLLFPWLKKRW